MFKTHLVFLHMKGKHISTLGTTAKAIEPTISEVYGQTRGAVVVETTLDLHTAMLSGQLEIAGIIGRWRRELGAI